MVEMPLQTAAAASLYPSLLPIIHQWKGCRLGISFFHLHPLGRALIITLPRNSLAKTLMPTAALANIFGAKDGYWALAIHVRILSSTLLPPRRPPRPPFSQRDDPRKITDLCVVSQIVRKRMNVIKYLIFTAAPTFLRCDYAFHSSISRPLDLFEPRRLRAKIEAANYQISIQALGGATGCDPVSPGI